jgi:tRNA dimethylallyltransferase
MVIVGPTGVGKTKMSIELAKKYNAEIINADAMQVYRKLNIGTAKIKESEKENIKHHLLDIVDVEDNYSVCDYQRDARIILNDLIKKDKNVIIVGGTGLYIKALLYDYEFKKEDIIDNYDNLTNEEIYNKIIKINLDIDVHINNRKRLIRLLNKANNNNVTINKENDLVYDNVYFIGLTTSRDLLYKRINDRVDNMIKEGLTEEARDLYNKDIRSKSIMTAIGYKELYMYFDLKLELSDVIDLIKKRSRHYAKRQYTWFNNKMNIKWFDVDFNDFNSTVEEVIEYINKNKK